jgi:hydrogenase maturation protein HypF
LKQIKTWHIRIKGKVQGVGFRPFVFQLAQKFQLKGWVNNAGDGVHIEVNADEVDAKKFYDEVVINAPQLAHVTLHCMKEIASVGYEDFKIITSTDKGSPVVFLCPDFAMCENCRQEISDPANRRYQYAFTTCTQCGPRYSIIKQLPYDREKTTMEKLTMCSDCNEEYSDPTNRRHFSQTNSCPDCAIEMRLYFSNQKAIEKTITLLKSPLANVVWKKGDEYNWSLEERLMKLGLSRKEGDSINEEISKFIKHTTKDELQNIISGKEQISEGEIIQTTARFLRGSKEAGRVAKEKQLTKEEETEILKKFITENNLWITPNTKNFIAEGAEQKVYLNVDGKSVTKLSDAIFYTSWQDFLNSLLLHNYFFPDTAYTLLGFTEQAETLFAVLHQSFVKANVYTDLQQVEGFMLSNGFVKKHPLKTDFYHPYLGIILEDLHDENVLTSDSLITFIDTIFYLTPQFYKKDILSAGELAEKLDGLITKKKQLCNSNEIITKICKLWNAGMIVAIKGIGGYLLTCDASNSNAIEELRSRKHRLTKPFALMFPDINLLENEVHINEQERKELQSTASPIVLLQLRDDKISILALNEIAPHLSKIGVMLPYTPLYELLLQKFKKPMVATSGNISNAPIIFDDETAVKELNPIADYILVHNREIISPQDDSVVQYSRYFQHRIVLRRARGFAPFYLNQKLSLPGKTILATGALMKSSFSLLHQQNIHISQYLGDTDNYDAQKNYEKSLHHFLQLFQAQPEVILTDKHPSFFTTHFGKQLAQKWNSQLITVQHHEAHFASVLGEHTLLDEQASIFGVIWDGTGFGNDGQIWGGEFFVYHQHRFSRVTHFDYFNHFLDDKMATEPRLSAFSLCHEIEEATSILQPKFSPEEWKNYHQLIKKNELKTSSIGRLFDAVASLLGLIDKVSFEGEAAMLLEEAALHYLKNQLDFPDAWLEDCTLENCLSTQFLIKEIVRKINQGKHKSEIAAWFHVQLVLAVRSIAALHHCRKICFSGGVFQNGLLIDLVITIVGKKYQLYFNKDMSPNDENISFGQLMWFTMMKKGESTK